jgi:iron complex transport system substrate-binding protein
MNGADMNPSIRTVDGAEKLADGIQKLGLNR